MRTFHELTPEQQQAYRVWQSKLRDRTLSAEQHDECRREIDKLLWKGPNAQVLALKAEVASIKARLERLEFHAGLTDTPEPPTPTATPDPTVDVPDPPAKPAAKPAATGEETRGRKPLRFHPEKDANRRWVILDREDPEERYTRHGPFRTRKEAKEMADTLNSIPNPLPPGDYAVGAEAPPVTVTEEMPDGGPVPEPDGLEF